MRVGSSTAAILLVCLLAISEARNLVIGITTAGKSSLINAACGLDLDVRADSQTTSTTRNITTHPCGSSFVVDTIGVFDYSDNAKLTLTVHDVVRLILLNIAEEGISSVLWVWRSYDVVQNKDLEEVLTIITKLIGDVVPVAIVHNIFPGPLKSQVPATLARKFGVSVIEASLTNTKALRQWIDQHRMVRKVVLQAGWEDDLVKLDRDVMRKKLLEATLASCDSVRENTAALTGKIVGVKLPAEDCKCGMDCRRSRRYCCGSILGVCVSRCTDEWIDEPCQRGVTDCYASCKQAHGTVVAETRKLHEELSATLQLLTEKNAALLETCDKFNLGESA